MSQLTQYGVTAPLRTLKAPATGSGNVRRYIPRHRAAPLPVGKPNALRAPFQPLGKSQVAPRMPAISNTFPGIGNGDGPFTVNAIPPDANGAVGPYDYIQTVNSDFAIFNKDPSRNTVGSEYRGPTPINTLFPGTGLCQIDNDGDPTVVYDSMAGRWIISQFAVSGATNTFYECIAVSADSSPLDSFYYYVASYPYFNDYPKLSVWPDAYYVTYNMFEPGSNGAYVGAEACALDRASMLRGLPASQVCFLLPNSQPGAYSLLPATLDGTRLPPSGSPDYLLSLDTTTSLAFWAFHVDFATPSNSTFTGPTSIPVAAFTEPCGGGDCIPQPGTSQLLDSVGDRLMYRLAYRNHGGYESLVVDHAVTAGSSIGMRWYEIRNPSGTPTLYQEGTYAPDANYRWMGSIAEDHVGDMAMGYSLGSSSVYPSIAVTGRLASDSLGTMPQGEAIVTSGPASQTLAGNNVDRWGDYSSMTVDPINDCTFWYTNEYIPTTGAFNWKTSIASFTFPGCSPAQLIQDGGFESNPPNWTFYSALGHHTAYGPELAHYGLNAFFACSDANCDDRASQTFTVPATVNSATFSFWLASFSALGASSPNAPCVDHFYATFATPDGTVVSGGALPLQCETIGYRTFYVLEAYDVTSLLQAHAGQQLVLTLRGTTANISDIHTTFTQYAYTMWGVDDVSLLVY